MKKRLYLQNKSAWIPIWLALFMLLSLLPHQVSAQDARWMNEEMESLVKYTSSPGWFDFKEETQINPLSIFVEYKKAFNLGVHDEMRMFKTLPDELGMIHYRYQQYHKGIRVFGADYVVHSFNGRTVSANGRIIEGLQVNDAVAVTETQAVEKAIASIPATSYAWQNADLEALVKEQTQNPAATNYPKGEVLFIDGGISEFNPKSYRLAWKIDVWVFENGVSTTAFVDANTGEVFRKIPLARQCDGGTVSPTTWYGNRSISTDIPGASYILYDDCTGSHPYTMRTRDFRTGALVEFTDADNNWTTNLQRSGGTTHWNLHNVADYYNFIHGRSSFDNASAQINARLVAASVTNNACWDCINNVISYYDGATSTPTDDWNSIDIIAHEFTHGVTEYSADLVYNKESGALNESFSDIFGEATENYILGTQDWLVYGEVGGIRSFSNPNAGTQPDSYLGTNWFNTIGCTPSVVNDNCGVHTNSGVQNYWFYLLSVGGNGSNDFGEDFSVSGIGITTARYIAYRNLTVYLTSSSQYIDAREGALRSARDLYGACSNEEIQCGKAWFACHVGNTLTRFNYQVCGTISGSGNPFYQGINSVYSGGGGCATTITTALGHVTYAAGNQVNLYPGFRAYATGANRFIAYLEPCSYTVLRPAQPVTSNYHPADRYDNSPTTTTAAASLLSILPNPFSSSVKIGLQLNDERAVTVTIYDALGRMVETVADNAALQAGKHYFEFDARNLPQGVYMCVVNAGVEEYRQQLVKAD